MYVLMNEKKIEDHLANNHGFCLECGAIKYDPIEPDAVNYKCDECGNRSVVGFETALLSEEIIPSKDKYPMLKQYMKGERNDKKG